MISYVTLKNKLFGNRGKKKNIYIYIYIYKTVMLNNEL